MRTLTATEKDDHTTTATVYIEVKAVDKFGQESSASATNDSTGGLNIKPTDVDDFAITASKQEWMIPVIEGGLTIADDTPGAGQIQVSAFTLYYNGTKYNINQTSSANKYFYWKDLAGADPGSAALSTSNTNPSELGDWDPQEDFIIAINVDTDRDGTPDGVGVPAWNSIANEVIGSAYIQTAAIINAHISDLSADKINAGTLSADRIGSNTITVGKLAQNFIDSYGPVITDPTFSLTTGTSDNNFWDQTDAQVAWGAAFGESGPGLTIDGDANYNTTRARDDKGAIKYHPANKNNNVVVQIRIQKDISFDGTAVFFIEQFDEMIISFKHSSILFK